ncbi:MAG TPA: dihydropteroate synthase [Chryseolinea sp.]|nr:dihydropteroate synthase [Chryseolinea sp.]
MPKVMGILNVTPDSFYDGNRYTTETAIASKVEKMIVEGATFIDVGAYSSRPGADDVSQDEELKKSVEAIQIIVKNFPDTLISIDTFRSEVARVAIHEGASMVNDISGGVDQNMFQMVAKLKVPYILMHMRGNPKTMSGQTDYADLLRDIVDYFHVRISCLQHLGVQDIIIDPGFGFAKTVQQNFELLNHLDHFTILGRPLLAGLSRKSMIWKSLLTKPESALNGTTSLNTIALMKGVSLLRVHDVKEAVEAVKLVSLMKGNAA